MTESVSGVEFRERLAVIYAEALDDETLADRLERVAKPGMKAGFTNAQKTALILEAAKRIRMKVLTVQTKI